ncbi:MAG: hypothetical protein QOK07_977, partial [Gemmatimonadaceae bacterium]|nr:hypothetical protein [Gemmatimonadaceae bacterium]
MLALLLAAAIAPPRFADPERAQKLAAAFPAIEQAFVAAVERQHVPGALIGIIIDGKLVWTKAAGIRDAASKAPVTADTRFRIASMTKGFTAMAILKLRDAGRLSLDDTAAKYVPELASLKYPTKDSPPITIRHLLTHSEGFPEDNPWGDRQLARSNATVSAWMRKGIPFSNAPGLAYEYSNYGFAILGQIIERVSGKPYDVYVTDNILRPLGMSATTFDVPHAEIAVGHRWEDETWKAEPMLAHGAFGAMGGLWTTVSDLTRYVSFLMSAFPPRDDPESGPIRRASAREMQQAWRSASATATRASIDAPLQMTAASYGYGLRISRDCRFDHVVAHGGGLPGYGSYEQWLPEYGVGVITFANLTYTSLSSVANEALSAMLATGALQKRVVQPAPELLAAKENVSRLMAKWNPELAERVAADNLYLDVSAERRAKRFAELAEQHGACHAEPGLDAENALRGSWRMSCDRGSLVVSVTLAPTEPPTV